MTKLTRDDVFEIMGRLDDLRVAEILGTEASPAELVEAKRWAAGYQRTIGDGDDLRASVVIKLCDILRAEEPEWYDS